MNGSRILVANLAIFLGCGLPGCTHTQVQTDTPKTLFDWRPGASKEDAAMPEKEGEDAKVEEPEDDEIVTDRPDFTEASSTVGKGRIQLEAGYTYTRDRDSALSNHSYPEALLRIGMFANWFELRLGQNISNSRQPGTDGGTFGIHGGEDLYIGAKLGLTEQKGALPEAALIIQGTVPTGHRDLTANRVLPGLNLLYGWDVVPECLSVGGSTQGNVNVDDSQHSYFEFAQSMTVNYALSSKLGAYTELFAFFPDGAIAPGVVAEYYFDGGFTYKVTSNFQVDIRGGVGLNRQAEDYFLGTGFAVRY